MRRLLQAMVFFGLLMGCSDDSREEFIPHEEDPIDESLKKAISNSSETGDIDYYIMPESDDYANIPNQDPQNPLTAEKVALGKLLFFETGLAQIPQNDNCYEAYSCSSCHIPTAGFLPGRKQGIADGAGGYGHNGEFRMIQEGYEETDLDAQGNRPLNPINTAFVTNTLWSGMFGAGGVNKNTEEYWTGVAEVNHTGYAGLEAQNIEAFELHRMEINDHVLDDYGYRPYYDKAFPDFPEEERYSTTTSSFAISAYLRTLLTNKAPFQEYLKGKGNALTDNQKKGANLFFGKARCYSCHRGPSFSAMRFHALGTQDMYELGGLNTGPDDPRILGRGMFTGKESDMYRFKVPQLYQLKEYVSFFHGSSKTSLEEVIDFKIKATSENPLVANDRLSPSFRPIELTEEEKAQLIDFLRNGLYDEEMDRYVPTSVLSGNCFPNNDTQSKQDLGCE